MMPRQGFTPIRDVLPFMQDLARADAPVTLTRVIQGLGFDHPANVIEIQPQRAVLQTREIRLYASLEGHCHLHCPSFPSPVKASLVDRNLARCFVVLAGFTCVADDWVDRVQDRVQPKAPTLVTLQSDWMSIPASLIDLNPEGMGVFVRKMLAEAAGLKETSQVEIDLQLPAQRQLYRFLGTIIHSEPVGRLLVRLGIRLQPGREQQRVLGKYVSGRKEEILQDVNQMYSRALEPRRVEDLYF